MGITATKISKCVTKYQSLFAESSQMCVLCKQHAQRITYKRNKSTPVRAKLFNTRKKKFQNLR